MSNDSDIPISIKVQMKKIPSNKLVGMLIGYKFYFTIALTTKSLFAP